ncbi:MAG: hypothetical protein JOS17DRAFT_727820 [Linnemannia elongata]|nr:MAG: hypothetical protein JOS17DRAFT_727820 [Linnemannia elongata]
MSTQRTMTTATTPTSTAGPAKISAIELAIKSAPSYGYTAIAANSNNGNNHTNHADDNRTATTNTADRRERYLRRSGGHPSTQSEEQDVAVIRSASAKSGRDLLIRRFQSSLTDVFKELFDKYWWQPICDDYDLPLNSSLSQVLSKGIKPSQYTLGMTCAFAVGRVIAGLPDEEALLVDKYYSIMPECMRRFALLEHAVRMCTSLIPIKDMLKPLAEVCVRYRADAQAMHILEHMLVNQDEIFQLDYRWAYIAASRIDSAEAWVKIWAQKAPVSFFTSRQFSALIRELPLYGVTLIQASVMIHMNNIGADLPESTRRARSVRFTASLIEESLKLHERLAEGHGSVPQSTLVTRRAKYDRVIEHLARILFEEHELEPESWKRSVALALALHSLYCAVATSSESTAITDGMSSWVELLEMRATVGICASDFNVIVQAYGTLTNLNALALMLDAVGLYSLSMTLVDRMLADFYELEDVSRHQLGYPCNVTIQSLKSFRKELEQRKMQRNRDNGWIYDDVMETWVEMSPPGKKSAPQSTPHSPILLRRPLKYSLAPMRWSKWLGRQRGRDGENGAEAESEPDDDEGVYDAPMDLEVLARFTIEEDSENENRPGRERPTSPDSESEYNSSDNEAHRSDTSSSESDPSYEEDGGPAHEDALSGDGEVLHEDQSDDEAMARPSRRRRQEDNNNTPVLPSQVIIISDSTGHSDDDFQGSDGDGASSSNEEDRFIPSDANSQDSYSESSESIVMTRAPNGRFRQVLKANSKNRSDRKNDGSSGEDTFVTSDDYGDHSQESVDEASQESDWQPCFRKRSRQRSSQHRHALNTPVSGSGSNTQDEDNVPILPQKSFRQTRGLETRLFRSNAISTRSYNARSGSTSHSSKALTMEARSVSRRKRIIISDDDDSDDGQNDSNRDSNSAPAKSTWRTNKGLEKWKAAAESDASDSLPRTETRPRAAVTQSHTRKRIRIEDDNDVVSEHRDIFDESGFTALARKNRNSSRKSGGSESSKVKAIVVVAEDMGDDAEDIEQDWIDRRRTIRWPQTPSAAHSSSSRQPPAKKTSRIEISRFFVL